MANPILNRRLAMYLEAEQKVLSGQSYTIGNRQLTRANLSSIRAAIDDLLAAGATIDDIEYSKGTSKRVLFIDGC